MKALFEKAEQFLHVLAGMELGYTTNKNMAKDLNLSRSRVSRLATLLEGRGLLARMNKGILTEYALTEAGTLYVQKAAEVVSKSSNTSKTRNIDSQRIVSRLHALGIRIPYLNSLTKAEVAALAQQYHPSSSGLIRYKGCTLKLAAKALLFYYKEAVAELDTPIPDLYSAALADALKIISELEEELRSRNASFKLKRLDKDHYSYKRFKLHVALTNADVARRAVQVSDPYIIARSDQDRKVSMLADESVKLAGQHLIGFPEMEGCIPAITRRMTRCSLWRESGWSTRR